LDTAVLRSGSLRPGSGMDKKSGSGMNNPKHIFESLETIFGVKILEFFDTDPGFGIRNLFDPGSLIEKIQIRDKLPGSATLGHRVGT
jgi:hypothetical protein